MTLSGADRACGKGAGSDRLDAVRPDEEEDEEEDAAVAATPPMAAATPAAAAAACMAPRAGSSGGSSECSSSTMSPPGAAVWREGRAACQDDDGGTCAEMAPLTVFGESVRAPPSEAEWCCRSTPPPQLAPCERRMGTCGLAGCMATGWPDGRAGQRVGELIEGCERSCGCD